MSMINRVFLGVLLVLLASCNRSGDGTSSVTSAEQATQERVFSQGAWLRERLPADTIVYLRLPSPWRSLLGPADKATDRMFQSQAYVDAIEKLRADLAKDGLIGEAAQPLAGLLYRLGSPIEMATIAAGRMASPAANFYVTAVLDYADANALAAVLRQVPGGNAELSFDDQGYAQIPMGNSALFLHYDAPKKRLSLLGGMFANLEAFKTVRTAIAEAKVEPRAELVLEREIDAAGYGMVLWADTEALRPILGMGITDELARKALEQTKRIALGWGTVDGHGRLSVRAEISGAAWTRYLPQSPRLLNVKTAGTATGAVTLSWPTGADVKRMQEAFSQDADPKAAAELAESDAKIAQVTGLHLADWFAPFGPDLAVFTDEAGDFMALRLQDADAFKKVLDALQQKLKASHGVTERAGASIHHLRLPSLLELAEALGDEKGKIPNEMFAQLYARAGSHLFWLEEDGWLLVSGVPQPLIDRVNIGATEPLNAFFANSGGDPGATFSVAGTVDDAARRSYYAWLGGLVSLADLGGAELDLISLPTARELALPRQTAMAFNLQLREQRVQFDLNYAQHPAEWLGGSDGLTAVAVVGVLAAIAVPAYQDYMVRAEVGLALQQAAALKLAISEHYMSSGELPDSGEQMGMDLPFVSDDGKVTVDLDAGAILITFGDGASAKLQESYLYLLPALGENDSVVFRCGNSLGDVEQLLVTVDDDFSGTDVDNRYLPVACRAD